MLTPPPAKPFSLTITRACGRTHTQTFSDFGLLCSIAAHDLDEDLQASCYGVPMDPESLRHWIESYGRGEWHQAEWDPVNQRLEMLLAKELYDRDLYAWAQEQSDHLLRENWFALDWANLAEEIRGLAIREKHALGHHLRDLLIQLLIYQHRPDIRHLHTEKSRDSTLYHIRDAVQRLLQDSPSLRRRLPAMLAEEYALARGFAANFGQRDMNTFPETCPWTLVQVLDDNFLPEATPAQETTDAQEQD